MVESSKSVGPWRDAVRTAAVDAANTAGWEPPDGPLTIQAIFTLPRPAGHYRTGRNQHILRDDAPTAPSARPDLDKLIRSTLDALTDAGTIHDDANVFHLTAAKTYPAGHLDALDTPGAVIILSAP